MCVYYNTPCTFTSSWKSKSSPYLENRHSTSGHNQNHLQAESSDQRCGKNAGAEEYRAHEDGRATGGDSGVSDDEDTLREEENSVDSTDLLACKYPTSNEQTHAVATDRHQLCDLVADLHGSLHIILWGQQSMTREDSVHYIESVVGVIRIYWTATSNQNSFYVWSVLLQVARKL